MIPIAFSIIAPYGEIIAMSHSTNTSWQPEYNRIIVIFGKPAMAEQMYLAVYITLAKRIGVVLNQFARDLCLFTACILASLWISVATECPRVRQS